MNTPSEGHDSDRGDWTRTIRVNLQNIVQPHFQGVGLHAFHHYFPASAQEMDEVIYKRWRELQPSFVRINHHVNWNRAHLDRVAAHLVRIQETGAAIYLTTWDPEQTRPGAERTAYVKKVVDQLEYLINSGVTNLRYYCMTNELTLHGWNALASDMTVFRDYHQIFFDEFQARNLEIGLLATDASPIKNWRTIEWAAENMDGITAVYGGHDYFNDNAPGDVHFFSSFRTQLEWAVGIAKSKDKSFILGEFGAGQDGRTIDGVHRDCCIHFDTPEEPIVPIQLGEAVIAALNAGVRALAYWTFMDLPDDAFGKHYANKWGLFRNTVNDRPGSSPSSALARLFRPASIQRGADYSTRPLYYGYGLLTRYFRGPSTVFNVEADDPLLHAAALRHHEAGDWSIAVVNRNDRKTKVTIVLKDEPVRPTFRRYVYDPANVPQHPFGDLPGPDGAIALEDGRLTDIAEPNTLTVYTTAYRDDHPSSIQDLRIEHGARGRRRLSWRPNAEPDVCYYRVFRLPSPDARPSALNQIGSTISTRFTAPAGDGHFRVVAVNRSGNVGL